MSALRRFREWRARRALGRAVRLAGASTIAQWVLDGTLPEGESCPFGCDGQILELRQRLEDSERVCAETRGALRALNEHFRSQTELTARVVETLSRARPGGTDGLSAPNA